jgi:phosphoribosyl-ATP pyrophosphohydrolase
VTKNLQARLVAHEPAHSFVNGTVCKEDEELADAKVREWGFESELRCKDSEKEILVSESSGITARAVRPH